MAITAQRIIQINLSGDVTASMPFSAANNTNSPGKVDVVTLAAGNNTITPPSGGTTFSAVTIIPPVGNTNLIIIKGVAGDTGVALHKTDPTTVALDSTVANFVLNAAAQITGVRLVWS